MNGIKLFKKFLMPCGICAAIPVVKSTNANNADAENSKNLIRPSDLPIYTFEATGKPAGKLKETPKEPGQPPCEETNILEQGFRTVRKSVQDLYKSMSEFSDPIQKTLETGKAHSQVTIDYLREESNLLPRIGAIGVGGLSGLVLGLRGGKFKKLVYSSTGALIIASICYPKEAQEGMIMSKYYVNVAYNFLRGVKPGDEQLEIPWPKLPDLRFSNFKDVVAGAAKTAESFAGTVISKLISSFNDFAETPKPGKEKPKQD